MAYDLYPLPPSLKTSELVDTTDSRYLNQTYTPFVNPLKKDLYIELYNEKWVDKPIKTSVPPISLNHDTLKFPIESFPRFLSVSELHKRIDTCPPQSLIEIEYPSLFSSTSPSVLHNVFLNSDCLFFIQYTPEDTLKPHWFLI